MPPPNTPEEGLPPPDSRSRQARGLDTETSSVASDVRGGPHTTPQDSETERSSDHGSPATASASTSRLGTPDEMPRKSTSRMDFTTLEYAGPVSQHLVCPICHSPFVSPVVTTCGHHFCQHCFDEMIDSGAISCPLDRKSFEVDLKLGRDLAKPAHLILSNLLDELLVKCPNEQCPRVEMRSTIKDHYENECFYTKVPCISRSCSKTVCRGDQKSMCLHHESACWECDAPVQMTDMDDHLLNHCTHRPDICDHCGDKVLRHRYNSVHLRECTGIERACKSSGCHFKGKNLALAEHERNCPFAAMMQMNRDLHRRIDTLEQQLRAQAQTPSFSNPFPHGFPVPSPHHAPTRPTSMDGYSSGRAEHALMAIRTRDHSPVQLEVGSDSALVSSHQVDGHNGCNSRLRELESHFVAFQRQLHELEHRDHHHDANYMSLQGRMGELFQNSAAMWTDVRLLKQRVKEATFQSSSSLAVSEGATIRQARDGSGSGNSNSSAGLLPPRL